MRNELRRVVVTGVGLVTPLGVGVKHTWPRLLAGHSGIKSTTSLPDPAFASLPSRVAGIVPKGSAQDGAWDPSDHLSKSEQRNMAPFSQYAVAAAEEALEDSKILRSLSEQDRENTGVVIGSGIGNLEDQHSTSIAFDKHGHHKTHPLYVPRLLINMAAGHIAMRHGFQGANLAPTTACTTGLHSIIEGASLIQKPGLGIPGINDTVDVVAAGASEACIHPLAISGFARARSLSTSYNDTPEQASRPFDTGRDGFVIGEGAGVLILEERQRALERGATIYGEIAGSGMSCDASHMTAPSSTGKGARLAMERALLPLRASSSPEHAPSVDYINAHATGTSLGDAVENRALREILQRWNADPQSCLVNSTKGATGHLLGAAGAVEAIFTLLSMRHGQIPPTLNLLRSGPSGKENDASAGDKWDLNYVTQVQSHRPKVSLSNSFGFGGTNASVCFTAH